MMKQYFLTMQILLLLLLLPMLMIHIVYPDRADPVLCIRSMFLFCPVQLFWMTRHKLIQNVYRKATHIPFYLIQLCLFPGSQFFSIGFFSCKIDIPDLFIDVLFSSD